MIFIIDSNILISALIKDSITRKILVESGWIFFYPEIAFHEIRKYQELILEKSRMNEEEYLQVLRRLLKHIILVPQEQFNSKILDAKNLMGERDPNDVVFLALAMSINNSKIWSNDNDLSEQKEIKVLTTKDIINVYSQI